MIFFILDIFMVFLCLSHHAYASESSKNTIDCTQYRSCTKCANETLCSWSLEHQNCVQPEELWGNLMVHVETDCPQFTVAKFAWLKDATYSYTLAVSNDKKDFMAYLRRVTITCALQTGYFKGRVDQNEIKCDGIRRTYADFQLSKQMIYFYYIKFNNNSVILRLDNDSDYYVPHYDHECGVKRDDDCMTCEWTANGYINYFKRCASTNRCSGLYQFYDRRHAQNFTAITAAAATAVPLQCANASVQSVVPASAPWAGGTVVRVSIKNHRILTEKKSVKVTVAGRECTDLRSPDTETISCIVSPPPREEPKSVSDPARITEGSIVVEYGPWQRFSIASTFAFKLVNPRLIAVSPTCGPLSGGTPLTITGQHLDIGTAVRVVLGNDTLCTVVVRSPDRISCLTGATDAPTDGAVRVMFDGELTKQLADRQTFTYSDNPVLDASQSLAGIVSGGTAIPVRGRHFSCARNTTMAVHLHNGTVHQTGCQIHNDTFMVCRSPTLSVDDLPTRRVHTTTTEAEDDESEATPIGTLAFELHVTYDGGLIVKPRPDNGDAMPRYHLYADPVLDDLATVGHAVTVIGRNLDWGYAQYQGNDTVVRLLMNDDLAISTSCDVTSIDRYRIVCMPKAASDLDTVHAVEVTFGMSFRRVVHKRTTRSIDDSRQSWNDGRTTFVVAVSAALLLLCACLVQLCGRKIRERYNCSTPHFELQTPE